ncbi:hypothetical protein L208DRAFT_999689, partial [Tricholoma matsutake]
ARDGIFEAEATVDFQKGEQQKNIDYAVSKALNGRHMQGIKQVLLIYDIICQWFKYFKDCVAQLDYLTIPEELQLLFTIGDFHVKGHVIEHFTCFSLQFIKGVGVIDGEIVETLWSVLN